jgi:hypothetical protein
LFLVLEGIADALKYFENLSTTKIVGNYKLSAKGQRSTVNEWLKYQPADRYSEKTISNFENQGWINDNSGGNLFCESENLINNEFKLRK